MPSLKRRISITPADEQYARNCAAVFSRTQSLRNYASVSGVLRYSLLLMRQGRPPAAAPLQSLQRIGRRLAQGTIGGKIAAMLIEQALAELQSMGSLNQCDGEVCALPPPRDGDSIEGVNVREAT